MVGEATNFESTYEPIGQHGWVVKTDSFGCLVPNCQDVLKLDPIEHPVTVKAYPNPANEVLNLFYHDNNFSGKAELVIYDLSGKEIKRWKLNSNDMTYILEVAHLNAGTYIYTVTENGERVFGDKFVKR